MNAERFVAKQRVKYYFKALRQTTMPTSTEFRDTDQILSDSFWDYERTPRAL